MYVIVIGQIYLKEFRKQTAITITIFQRTALTTRQPESPLPAVRPAFNSSRALLDDAVNVFDCIIEFYIGAVRKGDDIVIGGRDPYVRQDSADAFGVAVELNDAF